MKRVATWLGVLGLSVTAPAFARATSSASALPVPASPAPSGPPVEVMATPAPATPPATVIDAGEPHADRVVLAPTAYTHPGGTFFATSYDLVVLQAGYAFTDATQLSVTVTPPLGRSGEVRLALLDATLKTALVRQGLVRAAALGSVSGLATNDTGLMLVGRVGGVVQLCWQPVCTSSVSVSSDLLLAGPALLMANGLGAVLRAGRWFSFLAELDTAVSLGSEGGNAAGVLAGGGVRLHLRRFAVDLAVLAGVGDTRGGLPLLAVTYRTGT